MTNKPKKKGTAFESAVRDYLRWALDDRRIERRTLTGAKDQGDIAGLRLDGRDVVVECKATARLDLPEHIREAETEAGNADATFWAVTQKRPGIGLASRESVGRQLVYMTLEQYALLLNHGQPLGPDSTKEEP